VDGIVANPAQTGLFYARTDVGGCYRWNDSTETWTPLTDMYSMAQGGYLGVISIAADPTNADNVYAAVGASDSSDGAILSSTNQGASWTVNAIGAPVGGNDMGRGMGERLAVDPNLPSTLFFGAQNGTLWKSTNSGANWVQVTSFPTLSTTWDCNFSTPAGLSFVVIDKYSGTSGAASPILFVGAATIGSNAYSSATGTNLWESTNGGSTWTEVAVGSAGPTALVPRHGAMDANGNLWLDYGNDIGPWNYGGGCRGSSTGVGQILKYNLTNGWSNVTPSTWSGIAGGLAVDPASGRVVVATLDTYSPDRLFETTNAGTSWQIICQPWCNYGASSATVCSTFNFNGAAWFTTGQTSPSVGSNPTNWVETIAIDPANPNRVFYGTGGGIFVSSDTNSAVSGANGEGVTWNFDDIGIEETVPLFLPPSTNGALLTAVGDLGGLRSSNLTTSPATGEYSNPIYSNTYGLDFAESNPKLVARVGVSTWSAGDIAFSTDNGQTWSPASVTPTGYSSTGNLGSVAYGADGKTVLVSPYSGYGSPVYTLTSGASWVSTSGLPAGALVAADRVSGSVFYGTSGSNLYVSTNGGSSFQSAGTVSGTALMPRPVFGIEGEVWLVTSGNALYRCTGLTTTSATITQISNVTTAYSVGFGMAATGQTHPAVFIVGTVGGQYGFFESDNDGGTWTQINDSAHQYGGLAAWIGGVGQSLTFIGGDETTYGRCYLAAGGRGYVYSTLVLGTPTNTPTSTVTPTFTPFGGSPTVTATPSPTPSATATASPICATEIDDFPTLNDNGTWSGADSIFSIVASGTAPSGAVTSGSSCMMVDVTTGASYNNNFLRLTGFTPTNLSAYTQMKIDVYVPAAMIDATYNNLLVFADCATCVSGTTTGVWYQAITSNSPTFVAGEQTLTYDISFAAGSLPLTATVSSLCFTLNQGAAHTGDLYVDNLRLVGACGSSSPTPSPSATASMTPSPSPSPSPTGSRSASPSPSASPTSTPQATATPSASASPTGSPSFSPTDSPSSTETDSPTPSVTLTVTPVPEGSTLTDTPTISPTFSESPSLSASPTATFSPIATFSPSPSPSSSVSPNSTATPSATPTSSASPTTAADTATGTPSSTLSSTPTRTGTPTATPSATPTDTSTAQASGTPTATPTTQASAVLTATATVPTGGTATQTGSPQASTSANGPLVVQKVLPLPNPGATKIAVLLAGPADSVEIRVWTVALVLATDIESGDQTLSQGWNEISLPEDFLQKSAAGLYYVTVSARRGAAETTSSAPVALYKLPR